MLPSDELGEKGESRFREICADALLICNKADRDRAGWDFLVEFPFDGVAKSSLDSRATPLSCHVQVKTIRSGNNIAKMRLSVAERLAKEVKPAFVYVFTVDENLNFSESYLMHILDHRLAKILKRLRKETALGSKKKINLKSISFSCESNDILKPTGAALREKLEATCLLGMHQYATAKKLQLDNLGFDAGKYRGSLTFDELAEDDLLDVLLGVKKDVALLNFEVYQTRFGIKLTDVPPTPATVTLEPHPTGKCILAFRQNSLAAPTVFRAEVFVARLPGKKKGRLRLCTQFFNVTVNFNEGGHGKLTIDYDLHRPPKAKISDFIDFWRMLSIFSSGTGTVDLKFERTTDGISIPILPVEGLPGVENCASAVTFCEDVGNLMKRVGASTDLEFTYGELVERDREVWELTAMLNETPFSLSFSADGTSGEVDGDSNQQMIFAKVFSIGIVNLAYYGIGKFVTATEGDTTCWTSGDFALKSIKILDDLTYFEQFIQSAQKTEKIDRTFRFECGLD